MPTYCLAGLLGMVLTALIPGGALYYHSQVDQPLHLIYPYPLWGNRRVRHLPVAQLVQTYAVE
jgi:hypothetical protein